MSMSKIYNILWIDDEWDKMTTFQQECEELHALHLVPFRTRKAGMEAFEHNIDHWDAVLLDAKMFDEGENEVARLVGLRKAIQRLDELSMKRAIPRFISTGQTDLMSDENFKDSFGEFYKKGDDDVRLISDMLYAIHNSERRQVKSFYKDVFTAIEELDINQFAEQILLDILVPMHYPAKDPNFNPVLHYNQLRQLVEYLFRACHRVGLIPDQCINGRNVNLNQSSLYLAGKNAVKAGVRYGVPGERIVPEYIESFIRSVLEFGNTHSHTVELSPEDELEINSILRAKNSNYIIFGLAMHICEVIIWLSDYISKHYNKEVNLYHCTVFPDYNGKEMEPEQDEKGVWHCGWCTVMLKTFLPGKKIRLKEVKENTRETSDRYPYFAKYDII